MDDLRRLGPFWLTLCLVMIVACSNSSTPVGDDSGVATEAGPSDGSAGAEGGALAEGGVPDSGAAVDAAIAPVKWTVAAEMKTDVAWENGVLAVHPTQPKTIAVKLEVTQFEPDISVAVSHDLGQSRQKVKIKSYANPGPGHYDFPMGFAFDPTDGQKLALLTQMPPTKPNQTEPEWDTVVFASSVNGGAGFQVASMQTNPWPPDGMRFVAGKKSRLAIRAQHVLYLSEDLGQTLKTVFDDSKKCLAHGDFAISPVEEPLTFFLVCKDTLLRCERAKSATKPTCATAQLPSGLKPAGVVVSPHEPGRVIVSASKQLAVSTDGGKSFTLASAGLTIGMVRVFFDPRPGTKNVYALELAPSKLFRSIDGGHTYQDVTPPTSMKPPFGTYIRDARVAADGSVVALAHPGVIQLAAP